MNIKILVATHKQYWMPEDSVYMPIHVGREGKADIGYTGDHTGDNISSKNANYCELTYWARSLQTLLYAQRGAFRREQKESNSYRCGMGKTTFRVSCSCGG